MTELGPYWRRAAGITAPGPDVDRNGRTTLVALSGQPTPIAPGAPPRHPRRRRRLATIAAGSLAAGAATAIALVATASDPPRRAPPPPAVKKEARPAAAIPYDFDGDGSQELALGIPGSGRAHAGVVVVRDRRRAQASADAVLTAADAGLHKLNGGVEFGTSIASADFNGDGLADLAVSALGRDLVTVIHGTKAGLKRGRVEHIHRSAMRPLTGVGRFGSRLLASDFNRDGFGDLVVGAPAADTSRVGSGAMQMLFGGPKHMRTGQPQTIVRPVDDWVGFGTKLRAGDIDGDGNVDLVEGAPDAADGSVTGHASYCLGTGRGRGIRCEPLVGPVSSGTSALAVADVDGDHYDDIIQGDAVVEPLALGRSAVGGEVRVWLGGKHGPAGPPVPIDQRPGAIPGLDEVGDAFGAGIDAGDLDGDDYADIVVAAPGEDEDFEDVGSVSVIRGGRSGRAQAGHTRFYLASGIPGAQTAGAEVGWSIAMLDVSGDGRLDVALTIRGADRVQDSVYVLEGRGKGAFAPGETKFWRPLRGTVNVRDPRIDRIRVGRVDGA